jgi:Arc/MetJ family transcription regulator
MITRRKTQLLIILAATCFFPSAYGQQNENPKRQLSFELTSDTPGMTYPGTKYLAYFHITNDRNLGPWGSWITTTSKWKEMSEKQRQFIQAQINVEPGGIRRGNIGNPFTRGPGNMKTPVRTKTYTVPGVSKEDVRKMAEAVIEGLDNEAHRRLERKQKELEDNKKTIAQAEKILPKLENGYKQLEAKAQEKTKEYIKTNYERDSITRIELFEHIQKNMEELARYMKLANFELVGLQARIDSIERFKASGNISDPGTLIKLDQMLIADEIERAGIMARRKAYEDAFRQTKDLYDIFMSCNDAAAQKQGWSKRLTNAQRHKNQAERVLSNLPSEMKPVEVYENKVVIMQVKQY